MKKVFSLLLMFCIMLPLFANLTLGVDAATTRTDGYYQYTVSQGTATIVGVDKTISGNVTIPSMMNGLPVVGIKYSVFENCVNVTGVVIPGCVGIIPDTLFAGCSSLKSVVIMDGITKIGSNAFFNCSNLEVVEIPNSVVEIVEGAWSRCSSIKEFRVEENNPNFKEINGVLFNKDETVILKYTTAIEGEYVIPNTVNSIADYAFESSNKLTTITIPGSVKTIGLYAFSRCSSLNNVRIPNGVNKIDCYGFSSCDNLREITIPNSVGFIGKGAFGNCDNLVDITLPNTSIDIDVEAFLNTAYYNDENNWSGEVLYIGKHLIEAKKTLTGNYVVEEGTLTIVQNAFYDSKISSIDLPESLKRIGTRAFYGCESLTDLVIPDSIEIIEEYAFSYCLNIEQITIPFTGDGTSENEHFGFIFGAATYSDNGAKVPTALKKVIISEGCDGIGEHGFYGCSSITEIEIRGNMNEISRNAFDGCVGIKKLVIPETVKIIGSRAFYNCKALESINIPNGVTNIGYDAFYNCGAITEINLPDGLESIENSAFALCGSLANIEIPDSVTSIGNMAFYGNKFTSVEIPDSVESIGSSAFYGEYDLTEVTIGSGVKTIYTDAFDWCDKVERVNIKDLSAWCNIAFSDSDSNPLQSGAKLYINGEQITDLVIPAGIEIIKNYAFYGGDIKSAKIPYGVKSINNRAFGYCSSMETIVIPNSVETIDEMAFNGSNNIKTVYFVGTETEWNSLGAKLPSSAEIIFVEVTDVKITKLPQKRIYAKDYDKLDVSDGIVTVSYSGGLPSIEAPLDEFSISGFDNSCLGRQMLTVSCWGKTDNFEIEVSEIEKIEVSKHPDKKTYLEDKDELDVSGGEITVYYINGQTENVSLSKTEITGFDNSVTGEQILIVSYNGERTQLNINVVKKSLVEIVIAAEPSRKEYSQMKDELDLSGGVLKLIYNNDTTDEISLSETKVTGFDNTVVGPQKLTVSYMDKTCEFEIEIIARVLATVGFKTAPSKTEYLEGKDELNLEGIILILTYDNGTTDEIDISAAEISGFDNTIVGQQTVKISYGGKTCDYDIVIVAKKLASIEIVTNPLKMEYVEAKDELDLSGGVLKLIYNNDTTDEISLSETKVTGFDNTVVGPQKLTVSYMDKTCEFEIEIIAALGDIDGSGTINILDVRALLVAVNSGESATLSLRLADIDGNGTINILDVRALLVGVNSGSMQ